MFCQNLQLSLPNALVKSPSNTNNCWGSWRNNHNIIERLGGNNDNYVSVPKKYKKTIKEGKYLEKMRKRKWAMAKRGRKRKKKDKRRREKEQR